MGRPRRNLIGTVCEMDDLTAPAHVYRLRPAELGDVEFLTDVSLEALRALREPSDDFDEDEWRCRFISWTEEQIRGEVPFNTTTVIEVGTERVGRVRVVRDGKRIELAGIQLVTHAQGHGIGTDIVEDLKSEGKRSGMPVELAVERDNHRARALYERLGFVKVGDDGDEERFSWSSTS